MDSGMVWSVLGWSEGSPLARLAVGSNTSITISVFRVWNDIPPDSADLTLRRMRAKLVTGCPRQIKASQQGWLHGLISTIRPGTIKVLSLRVKMCLKTETLKTSV